MRQKTIMAAALAVGLAGCGTPSESLVGQVEGSFEGAAFTPEYGVAIDGDAQVNPGGMFVMLGTGDLNCEDTTSSSPSESGLYVVILLRSKEVGVFTGSTQAIELTNIDGNHFDTVGGDGGKVTIDAVTAERVTGSFSFETMNPSEPKTSASGSFDVKRCF